jgi:hypothetical protein
LHLIDRLKHTNDGLPLSVTKLVIFKIHFFFALNRTTVKD